MGYIDLMKNILAKKNSSWLIGPTFITRVMLAAVVYRGLSYMLNFSENAKAAAPCSCHLS